VYVASSTEPQTTLTAPVASAKVAPPSAVVPVEPPADAPTPAPAARAGAAASEKAKSVVPPAPRDSLAEEEALLEAARSASASNPARALSLLRKHQAQFPNGQLGAERLYLTVDCLQRLGNARGAEREAAALLKSYPNSAYARRVQQLLPTAPSP
jgi:TolA-binding protein